MPSSAGYKRNVKQERKAHLANGGKEKDRKHAQAQRNAKKAGIRKTGDGTDAGHKTGVKSGGSDKASNLKKESRSSNRSKGGKIGNKAGKARGGRIGNKAGKAAGGRKSRK
jgi:hypothetical protein